MYVIMQAQKSLLDKLCLWYCKIGKTMGIGCEYFYTSLKVRHFRVSELITTGAKWGGYGSSGIPWHFWARCVKVHIQRGDSFFLFMMMYVLCLNQTKENIWLLYTYIANIFHLAGFANIR